MFLPVNMRKFCKQYFNFYCKWYTGSSHSRVLLKIVIEFQVQVGNSRGGAFFPVKLQAMYLHFWWKQAPSWLFHRYFAYFIIYFVNGCFWGTALGGSFIILSTLFILILYGKKVFWRALFAGGFFIKTWYCISCLLKINSALVIQRCFLHRLLFY